MKIIPISKWLPLSILLVCIGSCSKSSGSGNTPPTPPTPASFSFNALKVNGSYSGFTYFNVNSAPVLQFAFSAPIDQSSINSSISLKADGGSSVAYTFSMAASDSVVILKPASALLPITKYVVSVATSLQSLAKEICNPLSTSTLPLPSTRRISFPGSPIQRC